MRKNAVRSHRMSVMGLSLVAVLILIPHELSGTEPEAEYLFRFNPPDGTQFERRADTKVTEWQVFNAESVMLRGRKQRFGSYSENMPVGSHSQDFSYLARTDDRGARDRMVDVVRIFRVKEGYQNRVEAPGERKWRNRHRASVTIHTTDKGFELVSVPTEVDWPEASPIRAACAEQTTKWDRLKQTLDSNGCVTAVERFDVMPEDLHSTYRKEMPRAIAVEDEDILQGIRTTWRRRCGQWAGRSVSIGDEFATIDTVIVASPDVQPMMVFHVYRIEEAKRCGKHDCLLIVHVYDTDPDRIEDVFGNSFWDVYDGDFMPATPPDRVVLLGHAEWLIDPATLLVYEEKSLQRFSYLTPFEGPPEVKEEMELIHIVEENSKIKYNYRK